MIFKFNRTILAFLIVSFLPFIAFKTQASGIDTHAHLFMKQGMGWVFSGDFNDPLQSKSWEDRFSSAIDPKTLDDSSLDIVVAALYAHPLFTRSLKDSIRSQIQYAKHFVQSHPNWVLATHPKDALLALNSGKRVLILSLEGASGILESEEDLVEFVDKGGIRIVTLLHLTDDSLGGVAFLKGFQILSSPLAFFKSIFSPHFDENRIRINDHGLTKPGRSLARALLDRKVWLDLAHSSDLSQKELYPLLKEFHQPHLYTHTVLRKYYGSERAISNEQLLAVAETHGFVGVMPSEQMLTGTPSRICPGGVGALLTQFEEMGELIGMQSVGIGSDFNGGIPHLKPNCGFFGEAGFWNIGQSGELWNILRSKLNLPVPEKKQPALQFLRSWSQLMP